MSRNGQSASNRSKIGLMGGTFDPIHIGHLRIAEEVREELGLDRVLFVPAGNPVFKRDQRIAPADKRFAAVEEAIAGNPYFEASRIEIDRSGDTFTVDTLRELSASFPGDELYFIVGADAAETIGKWRAVDEIAALAHLAVAVGRPGFAQADELRATILAAAPFTLHLVQVTSLEISSSDIRERIAHGRSVRYLVPECVSSTCAETYVQTGAQDDPLSDAFFDARRIDLEKRVKPKRLAHVMGVADTCAKLARRYGLDVCKARLAGLLHDWDKGMDDDQARARVRELGLENSIDPWVVENMPRVLHGYTAAAALARDFPEIPADVLQAVERHTTAAVDMSDLDKLLYIADALEPGRTFGRIEELREAAKTATLDELYFQTYEYWTLLLFERRQPLHPDTIRIWNANALRWQAGRRKKKK